MADRSRRPHASPWQTAPAVKAQVLALRDAHPAWGGRKLHHALARQGVVQPPALSTIATILRRHGLLVAPPPRRDFVREAHRSRMSCGSSISWGIARWLRAASIP